MPSTPLAPVRSTASRRSGGAMTRVLCWLFGHTWFDTVIEHRVDYDTLGDMREYKVHCAICTRCGQQRSDTVHGRWLALGDRVPVSVEYESRGDW
jgi:hypothetical protein